MTIWEEKEKESDSRPRISILKYSRVAPTTRRGKGFRRGERREGFSGPGVMLLLDRKSTALIKEGEKERRLSPQWRGNIRGRTGSGIAAFSLGGGHTPKTGGRRESKVLFRKKTKEGTKSEGS